MMRIVVAVVLMVISFVAGFQTLSDAFFAQHPETVRYPLQFITVTGTVSGTEMSQTGIEPFPRVRVQRYSRIIWTNDTDVPIRITIKTDLGSEAACRSIPRVPQKDWLLRSRCWVTDPSIGPGGAIETLFDEQGNYQYLVEYVGTNTMQTGEIAVY